MLPMHAHLSLLHMNHEIDKKLYSTSTHKNMLVIKITSMLITLSSHMKREIFPKIHASLTIISLHKTHSFLKEQPLQLPLFLKETCMLAMSF